MSRHSFKRHRFTQLRYFFSFLHVGREYHVAETLWVWRASRRSAATVKHVTGAGQIWCRRFKILRRSIANIPTAGGGTWSFRWSPYFLAVSVSVMIIWGTRRLNRNIGTCCSSLTKNPTGIVYHDLGIMAYRCDLNSLAVCHCQRAPRRLKLSWLSRNGGEKAWYSN